MRLSKARAASLLGGLALLLVLAGGGAALLVGAPDPAGFAEAARDHVPAVPTLNTWAVLALAFMLVASSGWMLASQRRRGG